MNTPNKLTILRIILVPFFVAFLLMDDIPYHYFIALVLFAGASITDAIDGHLARKHHLITDFGKFLDPLADKVLVTSALICFVELGLASAVVVVIIIAREFLVTSLRLVASGGGKVIAASIWGKLKTVSQMVSIVAILALQALGSFTDVIPVSVSAGIGTVLLWISVALTVISGLEYMWVNRSFIKTNK